MIVPLVLRSSRLALVVAVTVLWTVACGEDVQGPGELLDSPDDPPQFLSTLIVSNPVVSAAVAGGGLSGGSMSGAEVAFISLPPGNLTNGEGVIIRNRGTGTVKTAAMVDGGFDPVPVTATAGDTLDVRVEMSGGALLEVFAVVPASRPPVVVRTDPPLEERDVWVYARMLAVFSEPIDPATLTGSSVQLLWDGMPVPGTPRLEESMNLVVTLTPAQLLDPGTDYTLLITQEIEDLDGDAVAGELRVDFRTVGSPPPRIELLDDLSSLLEPPDAPPGSVPVAVGLFMSASRIGESGAVDRARELIANTNEILEQCDLHLVMEAAQVIALPPHLLTVQGNEIGSWGGHPPDSVGDPDLFMYYENERLTTDTRELFAYGKRYTTRNAIAIFTVEGIEYYIGAERTGAAGLAFPPVIFHHPDDYPVRNSVLATAADGRLIAHELGHMLLNTGDHWGEGANLMLDGTDLTSDQCDRMHENRERLFGDDAVPDPGPPTTEATAIAMVSGNDQVGKAGEFLELPFAVGVTDAQGEGVPHVHVTWSVTSGAGRFFGRAASRTGSDGIGEMRFLPTAVGTSTVTAEVAGLDGSPVTFSVDAPILVISLRRGWDPWTGQYVGDPYFLGPEGGSDATIPVGATVEWSVIDVEAAHIVSTLEPTGGLPFDSGTLARGDRFQFGPGVSGTWEFEDQVSGATGTLTAR